MRRYVGGGLIKLEGEPSRKIVRKKAPHTGNTKHTNYKALTYIRGEGSGGWGNSSRWCRIHLQRVGKQLCDSVQECDRPFYFKRVTIGERLWIHHIGRQMDRVGG